MEEVDHAFIQQPEHRAKAETVEADDVPLIDLGGEGSLVAEIGDACKKWGFFQVINHGVPLHLREKMEVVSREFFGLQKEEKKKVARDEAAPLGYFDTERTENVRDWKEVFEFAAQEPIIIPHHDNHRELKQIWNQWPSLEMKEVCLQYGAEMEKLGHKLLELMEKRVEPSRMEVCLQYGAEMEKLGHKLLELMALSLGLERERLRAFFEVQTSLIRLNHYPACPAPGLALGVGRHKDDAALTVLAQDEVGGLQVKRRSDGEWILVQPIPNAYVINVGDIMQVWSNGEYESVEHRVTVNSEKERFSIPFFLNPSHYVWVEPLHELVDEENPSKYEGYSWGKFYATQKLYLGLGF